MTMNDWYRQQAGVAVGPFSFEELSFLASRGKLKPDDLVRCGERGTWNAASQVEGLLTTTIHTAPLQTIAPVVQERIIERPQPTAVEQPEAKEAARKPAPPPLPPAEDDRRRKMLAGAMIGGVIFLLLVLLLMVLRSPSTAEVAEHGVGGTTNAGRQGSGSGDADSQGSAMQGDTGGRPSPGRGGHELEEQKEQQPQNESPAESAAKEPMDAQNEKDNQVAPNDGGAPVKEEMPPEVGGFTIRKFVPQEENDEDSVLGGGRGGGPQPEMFQGRDPEKRAELAEKEGGSPKSEAAVELGLQWLVNHQYDDGRWSLGQFMTANDCANQCSAPGVQSDAAATGLALMPLLGAGHTHGTGKYQRHVRKGLEWLIKDQAEAGNFQSMGAGTMYAHGQASIALCEAYAMTKDKELKGPAQKAVDYICAAQHAGGGWRYGFNMPGDTSVMGWQILALKSAQSGGLRIAKDVFSKANNYLDTAQADKSGGRYSYTPHGGPHGASPAMSAEGILCRMYGGWKKNAEGLNVGVDYLLENMPNRQLPNMYYWYYATQVLHHKGGDPWKQWNEVMRDTLIDMQETVGHQAGSWTPNGGHSQSGGRIYMTSLALCTLEVYYRHAALFD